MRNIILLLIPFYFLVSCESWLGEQTMPQGRGEPGEIILVMDSTRWAGDIGKELRLTFRELVEGLPRDEPLFDLRHVVPTNFKGILRNARNLVLVIPLNDPNYEGRKMKNLFTPNSLDSLNQNNDIFMINRKNLYATGQQVLFLIHHEDADFREKIINNRNQIRHFFNTLEERRTLEGLYKIREEKTISAKISEDHGFDIRIPFGFRIAENSDKFIWLRMAGQKIDKNIFVAYKDYNDVAAFDDENIIQWRDDICRKYIYGNPDKPDSYLVTEMLIPPTIFEVNFNGKYGKKMLGRWKTNSVSMGGPFVSYTLVDESSNRMYYLEGFLYSPGVDQRELMRELNVILKTFRTSPD